MPETISYPQVCQMLQSVVGQIRANHEMLSRPFASFVHPDDLGSTAEAMSQLLSGLPVTQFTNRYLHADGHYLHLEWVAKTEFEGSGNIYAVARDVTNRAGAKA